MNNLRFQFKGSVWRLGDDVDTDAILPAKYLNLTDEKELGKHCMEEVDPGFHQKIQAGDILVAGKNFGCGSSREHAPIAIRGCGFSCVVATSFSRLFYRNAINIGLPLITIDNTAELSQGDMLEVECIAGRVHDITTGKLYNGGALPAFMLEILKCGGLVPYMEKRLQSR